MQRLKKHCRDNEFFEVDNRCAYANTSRIYQPYILKKSGDVTVWGRLSTVAESHLFEVLHFFIMLAGEEYVSELDIWYS